MLRIKAGLIAVEPDVRARLLFKPGISLCVNTKTRLMCRQCISLSISVLLSISIYLSIYKGVILAIAGKVLNAQCFTRKKRNTCRSSLDLS